MSRERFTVLGVAVDAVDPATTLREIEAWMAAGRRDYVCFLNVHGVMEANRDDGVRMAYARAGLTVPDGMPLVWLGRWSGHPRVARVYGPELTLSLCELAARRGYSCFFYGGRAGVAERLARTLGERFPELRVAGVRAPPFRSLSAAEEDEEIRAVNAAAPDMVFVGLGCPKQERWMASHRARLAAGLLVGVGAAFDIHAGLLRQAPRPLRRAGLEWLFRLSQEPRRLWRRYLLYNPQFVLLLLLERLGRRRPPA